MKNTSPEKTKHFHIRIPESLWRKTKELAERNRRTLSAEILIALEKVVK